MASQPRGGTIANTVRAFTAITMIVQRVLWFCFISTFAINIRGLFLVLTPDFVYYFNLGFKNSFEQVLDFSCGSGRGISGIVSAFHNGDRRYNIRCTDIDGKDIV